MKITLLVGTTIGSKTNIALQLMKQYVEKQFAEDDVQLLSLADYQIQFSDGRNYLEYEGDTGYVAQELMDSDVIIIGTPIFQASLPGTLKNIFDLLPQQALLGKVVGIIVTAGSGKHYLVAEQQLKPILSYMKAQLVQTYVFIEEKDFQQKTIVNDDVLFRMERLAEDVKMQVDAQLAIQAKKDAEYGF
ncbi:FMN reductase [Paenibacillus oryzae]|uniref:FMN reductase n=1 Tax=Paenibacillus oryzae TaxID=1844972 RepID=A0A1A5YF19_9BACL|nr:NADPH-dependent FMN reductase [Paenibacillus oryzae]OBR64184.1 FMN reductase [Paenibacillus oryzae]